ncbi:hypothetical protein PR048_006762 [Dryococelus australis]|uniref:DDE Tnp4 domain-containing protein n=1 Tax=Dryococelus australis TaxID=614101 RepID=A0ABQ9IBU7_9NEOP|nr:hypothetical protein PR048_006762 [Dryococelus australis]
MHQLRMRQFVDRHGDHSLNCLAFCGPDMQFYYVDANWPDSVRDARVLRNTMLHTNVNAGWIRIADGVLLENSAYPLKEWLIPPIVRNQNEQAEELF